MRWHAHESIGKRLLGKLGFVPGNYPFVVVGKAYRTKDATSEATYHTYTDQLKQHVGLDQVDAMLAAMFGGLLAYVLTALRQDGAFSKFTTFTRGSIATNVRASLVVLRGLASAAPVSASVTILMVRISDTQFPIKVSVADFWGALTVGFIAFFIGDNLIERIVRLATGKPPPADPPEK
jgi:hypothetical protein